MRAMRTKGTERRARKVHVSYDSNGSIHASIARVRLQAPFNPPPPFLLCHLFSSPRRSDPGAYGHHVSLRGHFRGACTAHALDA